MILTDVRHLVSGQLVGQHHPRRGKNQQTNKQTNKENKQTNKKQGKMGEHNEIISEQDQVQRFFCVIPSGPLDEFVIKFTAVEGMQSTVDAINQPQRGAQRFGWDASTLEMLAGREYSGSLSSPTCCGCSPSQTNTPGRQK